MATKERDSKPGESIDPADEPSVDWGWHGSFPRGRQIAGWISVVALVAMLYGNHQGILSGGDSFTTADGVLIAFAAVLSVMLLMDLRRRRRLTLRR